MNEKILNILILSLVFLLVFNYLSGKETQKQQTVWQLIVSMTATEYTVPAKIGINFQNNTAQNLTFSPCTDLEINKNGVWEKLTTDCTQVQIPSWEKVTVDFAEQYQMFLEKGNYVFEIQLEDKKYILPFEIAYRGTITKLFITLFYQPIYNLMVFLIVLFSDSLGWAIIAVTIIIRTILIWPQHKMMVSQKKLQNIQPKIKDLQDKHKGDAQTLWMELMALYKRENVNPMGSCGLLIIQLPILLVIYRVIMSIQDISNTYYLYDFLKGFTVNEISMNFYGLDLLSVWGISWIILWLAVWIVQFFQIKLSLANNGVTWNKKWLVLEKKPGETGYNSLMPDPEFMNKFMLYGMPAMVVVFTYSLFLWVGIYWGVSTLFTIFQQLFVNKLLKK